MTPTAAPVCPCGVPLRRLIADTDGQYETAYLLYRCEVCDLISPDPLPEDEQRAIRLGRYRGYADAARLKNDIQKKRGQAKRLVSKIERALKTRLQRARFLEVGCAAGALLSNLVEYPQLDAFGVELDPENAEVAKRHLGSRVSMGSIESAPLVAASFDIVYADQVIEHVLHPPRFIAACRRVLKPGGILIMATPNFDGVSARILGLGWKEFVPDQHVRMFTPRALRFYLEQAGLVRLKVATQGLSLVRRRDRKDLLSLRRESLPGRLLMRGFAAAGVGDGLSAVAFEPPRGPA